MATSPVFTAGVRTSTDQRVVLRNLSWDQYEAFVGASADGSGVRTVYLDGELEILSPSPRHEHLKKLLARLLEAYGDARGLPLNGLGSTTFRRKAKKAGLEPDECYVLGPEKPIPDLAIELVLTSGDVDKLEAYRRLGVPEVWFWVKGRIRVYALDRGRYGETTRSVLLPKLDLRELERILASTTVAKQAKAVRSFRARLAAPRSKRRR